MTMKLGRQAPAAAATAAPKAAAAAPAGKLVPAAWGNRGKAAPAPAAEPETVAHNPFGRRTAAPSAQVEQRNTIEGRITQAQDAPQPETEEGEEATPAREIARQQFSGMAAQAMQGTAAEADAMAAEVDRAADGKASAPRTRRRKLDITDTGPVNTAYESSAEEIAEKKAQQEKWDAEQLAMRERALRNAALANTLSFIATAGVPEEGISPDDVVAAAETFLAFLRG